MKLIHRKTFKTLALAIAALFLALDTGTAQATDGDFVWAKGMEGPNQSMGKSVALDTAGNVYTTGSFQNTVDFDPGAGNFSISSAGSLDIFVSKLDANGNLLWAKTMGGINPQEGLGIAVDAAGNVYTTGRFYATADFDPGAGTFNLTSSSGVGPNFPYDIFVSKLDTNGNFVWAKAMGGAGQEYGYSIALDAAGNVFTTGYFEGTADFDPGIGTINLTSPGSADIFVSKLDSNGNFVWANRMGGTGAEQGYSLALDASGNVYTTGYFQGTTDFDPGIGTFNLTSSGGSDIFISKLDANGNFVWAKTIGGTNNDGGTAIAVSTTGNVYTTGSFEGTVDFDPGSGTFDVTATFLYADVFISKIDTNGNFVWAGGIGGTYGDIARSVAVDALGNVYTTGLFDGIADFDPGAATFNLDAANGPNFVSRLDKDGNFILAQGTGGDPSSQVEFNDIALFDDTANGVVNVHTTGGYMYAADFDPGVGTFLLGASGDKGIFVQKLTGPETIPPTFTITTSPYFAEVGQTVHIMVLASEVLKSNPTVTINTNTATFVNVNGLTYEYTYMVTGADALGAATIEAVGQDTSSNIGISTNNTSLVFVAAGSVPLAAWPGFIALATAGALVLRRRKSGAHVSPRA